MRYSSPERITRPGVSLYAPESSFKGIFHEKNCRYRTKFSPEPVICRNRGEMLSEILLTDRGSGKKWDFLRSCQSSQAILVITPPRPSHTVLYTAGSRPSPLDFLRIPTILLYMDRIIERIYHGKIDY